MDHFLYVASSGASEIMHAQAVNSHNLANASTPGFRANLVMAQSAYVSGAGINSRIYSSQHDLGMDTREGSINATGNLLDIAINGEGWISVLAVDGTEALSRRGDFRVNEFGQLSNGVGQSILGNGGPIAIPPYSEIAIGSDGTLSIVPLGEDPNTLVVIDRIKLVNPADSDIYKAADGLVRANGGKKLAADASVKLISGSLESSNVNSIEAMVRMIELARQFETQVKIMKTAEQLDEQSSSLMRVV